MNTFEKLGIASEIQKVLSELGYEVATPIQERCIPDLLAGKDVLGQAQTGTGKTAAFALPILSQLKLKLERPQALILAPTRELAIQVAESFQSYAKYLTGFHVLPIYGGQDFGPQFKALKRGVQVVVGTPGRIMDHLRRGTLSLDKLKTCVLDEADEMLKMGFIDDVQWILQQIPHKPQIALFSATMPTSIKKIANKYLVDPSKIQIKTKTTAVAAIEQCCMLISKNNKLEALTRFLEVEEMDAAIIFTRTKTASSELADRLNARGYSAAAMHGDMSQALREKVIERLKRSALDIVVATDVAARGLDVERISHVINFDIPYDPESYIHRIGRTGRAGRKGKALLFVTPNENRMLKDIERTINQRIETIQPPSASQIKAKRAEAFTAEILQALAGKNLDNYRELIGNIVHKSESSELDIAAALAYLAQKEKPLHIKERDLHSPPPFERTEHKRKKSKNDKKSQKSRSKKPEAGMTRCRIEIGRAQGVGPGDIVGVIANKGNINSKNIGQIQIFDNHSFVDISSSKVEQVIESIYKIKLKRHQLSIRAV